MHSLTNKQFQTLIIFVGAFFFIPFLGGVHLFDWDEINFAESAREMLLTGNYRQVMVNFEPFWEKPPLFFWLQALSMKIFGVNEFAARFPNAVIGIISLLVIHRVGQRFVDENMARWWVLLYLASVTPHFYFHSGIIDPLFNLFIFLTIIQLHKSLTSTQIKPWLIAGLWLGLAVLTKGPAAGLIVLLVLLVMWVRNSGKFWFSVLHILLFGLISILIASIWFVPEVIENGFGFLQNFIAYQLDLSTTSVASHGQPWFYHAVVLLIGCFPASILAIKRFGILSGTNDFESILKIMFWVVLILFSLITTKIVHYSSLCYFPLTGLAAIRLAKWQSGEDFKSWEKVLLVFFSSLWVLIFLAIPIFGFTLEYWMEIFPNLIADQFTLQNLQVDAGWSVLHIVIGIVGAVFLFGFSRALLLNKRLNTANWVIGVALYLTVFLTIIVPKIEKHTQGSVIAFYKSIDDEDCYIDVYKFKSYAHYFYAKMEPLDKSDALFEVRQNKLMDMRVESRIGLNEAERRIYSDHEMNWFLHGEIDKPVYLIAQPRKAQELEETPGFELIQNTGGYWVFRRTVK